MTKAKNKTKRDRSSWIDHFIVVVVCILGASVIYLLQQTLSIDNDIDLVKQQISSILQVVHGSDLNAVEATQDYFNMIDSKINSAVDQLFVIAGLPLAIFTIYSAFLAFRAPKDIENQLKELRQELDSARQINFELNKQNEQKVSEAEFQRKLLDATYRNKPYVKIEQLNNLADEYPDRWEIYAELGFVYDDLKEYDKAISNYELAYKNGWRGRLYNNAMAVAFSNKGDNQKAIELFSLAIDEESNDSDLYVNRAVSYSDIADFKSAFKDLDKAINLNPLNVNAFINKTHILIDYIQSKRYKPSELIELSTIAIESARRAQQLDPTDISIKELAAKTQKKIEAYLGSKNTWELVAKIDERIGDLEAEGSNYLAAIESYISSISNVLKSEAEVLNGKSFKVDEFISSISAYDKLINTLCLQEIKYMVDEKIDISLEVGAKLLIEASNMYKNKDVLAAERIFLFMSYVKLCPLAARAKIWLSYLVRREESRECSSQAIELLEDIGEDFRSGIWSMNYALCLICDSNSKLSTLKAIEILQKDTNGAKEIFKWWSCSEVVGRKESNFALLLLAIAGFRDLGDTKSLKKRFRQAKKDGYSLRYLKTVHSLEDK